MTTRARGRAPSAPPSSSVVPPSRAELAAHEPHHDLVHPAPLEEHLLPPPTLDLDLASGAIQTIIWATGFRPDYSWLDVTILDQKGMVRHDGGVVDSPGMYLIGSPFLRRRKSSFIDGAREDAQDLIVELSAFLHRQASPTTPRHLGLSRRRGRPPAQAAPIRPL